MQKLRTVTNFNHYIIDIETRYNDTVLDFKFKMRVNLEYFQRHTANSRSLNFKRSFSYSDNGLPNIVHSFFEKVWFETGESFENITKYLNFCFDNSKFDLTYQDYYQIETLKEQIKLKDDELKVKSNKMKEKEDEWEAIAKKWREEEQRAKESRQNVYESSDYSPTPKVRRYTSRDHYPEHIKQRIAEAVTLSAYGNDDDLERLIECGYKV